MVNGSKVRGKITENGLTIGAVAKEMGISAYTLGRKLSNRTIMTLEEAWKIQKILEIPDEQFKAYFFTEKVA